MAPELDSIALATQSLQPDAIDGGHPAAVGDRVAALDRLPGVELLLPVFFFLRWMPADRGRVEQNVRPLERGESRAFGVPLIRALQRSGRTDLRLDRVKA